MQKNETMRASELKLRRIGNSRGVIIPADILIRMNAADDAVLTITVNDKGVATLENKANKEPFSRFTKFAEAWSGSGDAETERINKEFEIW